MAFEDGVLRLSKASSEAEKRISPLLQLRKEISSLLEWPSDDLTVMSALFSRLGPGSVLLAISFGSLLAHP